MLAAVRAELLDLEPVGVVPSVLLGDVVAVFAHLAGQRDLWPNVGTGRHVNFSLSLGSRTSLLVDLVAMAGLEPAT
jgi:hypothetical protein